MTLENILYAITELGIKQKVINFAAAGADIYAALNDITIKDYPILFVSPTGSHTVGENTTQWSITLYYLDRLLDDGSNDVGIMSTAIEQLKNMVLWIKNITGVVDVETQYDVRHFTDTESFNDRVCGAWTTIRIETLNAYICPE